MGTIRALTTEDVATFREIRLRALAGDPTAFRSNLEREAAFGDDDWVQRLGGFVGRPGQLFVDEADGATVGVVGIGLTEDPTNAMLWGMWVDPTARGTGVGTRLIDATMQWCRSNGVSTVTLFVMRSNGAAMHLYERYGFDLRPDAGDDAPPECDDELRMTLKL